MQCKAAQPKAPRQGVASIPHQIIRACCITAKHDGLHARIDSSRAMGTVFVTIGVPMLSPLAITVSFP